MLLIGLLLGFAACWLVAGALVVRVALQDVEWQLTLADDALPILIGVVVWPWLLTVDVSDD